MRSWHDCPPEEVEGDNEASNAYLARLWSAHKERTALKRLLAALTADATEGLPFSFETMQAIADARKVVGE